MPSPQTPLPERARGFENLQLFLAPLLLLWEKGLGDEGKRFVSQSGFYPELSFRTMNDACLLTAEIDWFHHLPEKTLEFTPCPIIPNFISKNWYWQTKTRRE
jgi:hypothetical protein